MDQIEAARDPGDVERRDGDVLRVETAPVERAVEPVAQHLVPGTEPAHARPHPGDDARAVGAEHQRETRPAGGIPAIPDVGVPPSDARGMDRDEHLAGREGRDRKLAERKHAGTAEAIDGGGFHGFADASPHAEAPGWRGPALPTARPGGSLAPMMASQRTITTSPR